jgi:thiazole synthase ThiGH ThiG subunit
LVPVRKEAILASGSEMVTEVKRIDLETETDIISLSSHIHLLPPNTRNAKEGFAAQLARETNWLKLEIHPDPKYLMRMQETLKATEALQISFIVLPTSMLILFYANI